MARRVIRVLGIDPTSRGLCFAVVEGLDRLVAWGCHSISRKTENAIQDRLGALLDQYDPDFVAVESPDSQRKGAWALKVLESIALEALDFGAGVRWVSSHEIRRVLWLQPGASRHQVASVLADRFPELASRLPSRRRPWQSEAHRMNVFDATGIAFTAYSLVEGAA